MEVEQKLTFYSFSVVTGTPPTITEDATIRAAPALLSRIESNHRTLWILGQVELCLVWGKVLTSGSLNGNGRTADFEFRSAPMNEASGNGGVRYLLSTRRRTRQTPQCWQK